MALTVSIEANIALTVGVAAVLVTATVARKAFTVQNQTRGIFHSLPSGLL